MSRAPADPPTAGPARLVVCVLLAFAGAALALGTLVDLWVGTLNFGGPHGAGEVTGGKLVTHVLVVLAAVGIPVAAMRLLLGRSPAVAVFVGGAAAMLLVLAVLGLAR